MYSINEDKLRHRERIVMLIDPGIVLIWSLRKERKKKNCREFEFVIDVGIV